MRRRGRRPTSEVPCYAPLGMDPSPASRPAGADPSAAVALDPDGLAAVQAALLAWFGERGRDLPWRRTRDPWRVLVSEVMLQQIAVPRAAAFYGPFLQRFPTVHALAAAPLADAIRA